MRSALEETYPIEGTVFTPNGEPVKGAQVYLTQISHYPGKDSKRAQSESWGLSLNEADYKSGKLRDYWPTAATSDAEGRFRIEGAVARTAAAKLMVLAEGFAATNVWVADANSERSDALAYREPKFTLVLERPFVVEGRYTDEKSGQPIAGVRIEIRLYHHHGNSDMDYVDATSDADGRYTLRIGPAEMYGVHVETPLGYPGIQNTFSSNEVERLAGTLRKINYPIKLRRGVVLHGKVIDQQTGDGVAGAEVSYRLAKEAQDRHQQQVLAGQNGRRWQLRSHGRRRQGLPAG